MWSRGKGTGVGSRGLSKGNVVKSVDSKIQTQTLRIQFREYVV